MEPKLWRRRFGSALLDRVVTDLQAWGRRLVLGGVSYPLDADETHPARRFAVKNAASGAVEYEPGGVTPDDFAARLDVMSEQGRTLYTCVAFDRDGVPVAHTELSVPVNDPDNIFQWSTLVRRQDRGHRLGVATKARNLRRVQRRHPGRTSVHTWNAETNTAMIAVNEALGFEAVGYASRYQRTL